jgi:hypothetical protein
MLIQLEALFVHAHPSLHPLSSQAYPIALQTSVQAHQHASLRRPTAPWSLF